MSPYREDKIKEIFGLLGEVKKIQKEKTKTADFLVEGRIPFVIEVMSINIALTGSTQLDGSMPINLKDKTGYIESINNCINHALEKDSKNYPIVCVIWVDEIQALLGKLSKLVMNKEFVMKTRFGKSKLGALLFIFDEYGGNVVSPKPVSYIKNKDLERLFRELPITSSRF